MANSLVAKPIIPTTAEPPPPAAAATAADELPPADRKGAHKGKGGRPDGGKGWKGKGEPWACWWAAKQRDRPLDAEFHYGAELPDECAQLELKSSFDHADIARTVCGLLNCVGGVMLIGAGDDGVVRGIPAAAPGVLATRATRVVERDGWPRPTGLLRVEAAPVSGRITWGCPPQQRYLVRVVVRDLRTCGGGRREPTACRSRDGHHVYYASSDAAGNHASGWRSGGRWWVPYVRARGSTRALEPLQVKHLQDGGRDVVWKGHHPGPKGEDAEGTFGADDEAYAAEQKVGAMPAVEEAKTATAVRNR